VNSLDVVVNWDDADPPPSWLELIVLLVMLPWVLLAFSAVRSK
jgi:hypothetical protein